MKGSTNIDPDKLGDYLQANLDGFKGPVTATKFADGQSNPTFLLEASSGKYVLRRKPTGVLLKSAHAVDREFRVIRALQNSSVPVADAYCLCEDDAVIGSAFYVMEFVDGSIFWNPTIPELDKKQRSQVYDEMNRVLAALHSIDVEEVGLSDFGYPGNYFERQFGRWTKQYRATETQPIENMERLIEWLDKNAPEDDGRVSLVHGDYRLDNMIFANDGSSMLALVDWELSTLGHPFADLAYQCMQWRMPATELIRGLGDLPRNELGVPEEQEYVAQYCERMGIPDIPNWEYYVAFSGFRLAAILQGVKKRAIEGNASSEKAHLMGEMVEPLVNATIEQLG